ncbi:hypothetical protein B0J11DRAFT_505381 [Dendryphion nanum]|uniref:Uncharacterized protein n=1 Tax=Dendryphion nanum TaxID=256645 RepID=A0A9P9DV03_9PLEO|nr:hypothetical protein B0J11DRAFT_505381 [Dendryphion nanum]
MVVFQGPRAALGKDLLSKPQAQSRKDLQCPRRGNSKADATGSTNKSTIICNDPRESNIRLITPETDGYILQTESPESAPVIYSSESVALVMRSQGNIQGESEYWVRKYYFPQDKHCYPDSAGETEYMQDSTGRCWVASPIPFFTKPLALNYNNFRKLYHNDSLNDKNQDHLEITGGTRMEAACFLLRQMLDNYYRAPRFFIYRIWSDYPLLGDCTSQEGFSYLVVVDKQAQAPAPGVETIVLVAIAGVAIGFLSKIARTSTSILRFTRSLIQEDHSFSIDEKNSCFLAHKRADMRTGQVVVLGGKTSPMVPSFEFYNFDSRSTTQHALVPWFGQTRSDPIGVGDYRKPLDEHALEDVDRMFKNMVKCASGDAAVMDHRLGRCASQFMTARNDAEANQLSEQTGIKFPKARP